MEHSFTFSSNSIKLVWKELLSVVVIYAVLSFTFPRFWPVVEKFDPPQDYRLSYTLSNDYWMFERWCKYASERYPVLVVGDSVIWGQYVKREHTLSQCLNNLSEKNMFVNLGVDGIHPAAMAGLIKYYGKNIKNKAVILHYNPLWMSSKKHDLQGEEEFRFNHPKLVPQFMPKLDCYEVSFREKFGVILDRNFSFFSWINHINIAYFENTNLQNWTLQNPYKNPLSIVNLKIPIPESKPKSKPISWFERGIKKQNFPWVEIEKSFQWSSFKKVIKTLKSRNNKVFVFLGPFNPYILTGESLSRYNSMKDKMEKWLKENKVSYYLVLDLPSEDYADASHPLKEGYWKIAKELQKDESFQKWMKDLKE